MSKRAAVVGIGLLGLSLTACHANSVREQVDDARMLVDGAREWRESCSVTTEHGICIRFEQPQASNGCFGATSQGAVLDRDRTAASTALSKIERVHARALALDARALDSASRLQRQAVLATSALYLADAQFEEFLATEAAALSRSGASLGSSWRAQLKEGAPHGAAALETYEELANDPATPATIRIRAGARASRLAQEVLVATQSTNDSGDRVAIRPATTGTAHCPGLDPTPSALERFAENQHRQCQQVSRQIGLRNSCTL